MKLKIKSEQGVVCLTLKKKGKRGLNIQLPIGMNGRTFDDLMFENEVEIEKLRNGTE